MPSILSVSVRAWQRAHQRYRQDDGAFQETSHDEEIQAEQSPETAASPPAAAAATRHHTPSCDPETPRECRPRRYNYDRRNPATHSPALRGGGYRHTASYLCLVALSGIRRQSHTMGLAVYGGSQDLIIQKRACCRQRGLRRICLQRADGRRAQSPLLCTRYQRAGLL